MPFNKNVDTSKLSPEQLAEAHLMQEYVASHEFKNSVNVVNLAERLLGTLIQSDHRRAPCEAFELALKYAEHACSAGESYLNQAFVAWKAARPVVEDTPLDEDLFGDAPASVGSVDSTETITRDDALADTERHLNA